ncbi:MAG: LL-diaminopimelate aminotransferase [Cyanobacteria bacterium P01_A01_bin.84]
MQFAQRLQPLGSNVFADMDKAKTKALAAGKHLIDLSLGSSDLSPAKHVIEAISQSLEDKSTHGYLLFNGTKDFRQAAAQWYENKFGIPVDPETEVLSLIGSQEGTAHLPLAILNPGDYALVQDPGYPSHAGGVYLANGEIYPMPLLAENNFLPIFEDIPPDILAKSRMMVLSYPHNPTAAIAPLSFLQTAVKFSQENNLVLVHDLPYVDLVFPDPGNISDRNSDRNSAHNITNTSQSLAPSILQADPEKSVSIEFFTLSKSYHMGGFRIGYAIGNPRLIQALAQVKAVIDFNQYQGILNGAIAALNGSQDYVKNAVHTFRDRRDVFVKALADIGWEVPIPEATMYIWAKLPPAWNQNSIEFCKKLVETTGVAASPGVGFGKSGEGYVRFALVHDSSILQDAVRKISQFF